MKKSEDLELWRLPKCLQRRYNCTANQGGRCLILTDTYFKDKTCPFFKGNEEQKEANQ